MISGQERRKDPDRLTKIEVRLGVQSSLIKQQTGMLKGIHDILTRVVIVEERQSIEMERINKLDDELQFWRSIRIILGWLGAISMAIATSFYLIKY